MSVITDLGHKIIISLSQEKTIQDLKTYLSAKTDVPISQIILLTSFKQFLNREHLSNVFQNEGDCIFFYDRNKYIYFKLSEYLQKNQRADYQQNEKSKIKTVFKNCNLSLESLYTFTKKNLNSTVEILENLSKRLEEKNFEQELEIFDQERSKLKQVKIHPKLLGTHLDPQKKTLFDFISEPKFKLLKNKYLQHFGSIKKEITKAKKQLDKIKKDLKLFFEEKQTNFVQEFQNKQTNFREIIDFFHKKMFKLVNDQIKIYNIKGVCLYLQKKIDPDEKEFKQLLGIHKINKIYELSLIETMNRIQFQKNFDLFKDQITKKGNLLLWNELKRRKAFIKKYTPFIQKELFPFLETLPITFEESFKKYNHDELPDLTFEEVQHCIKEKEYLNFIVSDSIKLIDAGEMKKSFENEKNEIIENIEKGKKEIIENSEKEFLEKKKKLKLKLANEIREKEKLIVEKKDLLNKCKKLSKINKQYELQTNNNMENMKKTISEKDQEFEKTKKEIENEFLIKIDILEREKEEYKSKSQKIKKEKKKIQSEYMINTHKLENEIKEIKEQFDIEKEEIKEQFNREREEIKETLEREIKKQYLMKTQNWGKEKKEIHEQFNKEKQEIDEKWRKEIERIKKKWKEEIRTKDEQFDIEKKEIHEQYNQEKEEINKKWEKENKKLEKTIKKHTENKIKDMKKTISEKDKEFEKEKREKENEYLIKMGNLEKEKEEYKSKNQKIKQEKNKIQSEYMINTQKLENEIKEIKEQFDIEKEEIKEQFNREREEIKGNMEREIGKQYLMKTQNLENENEIIKDNWEKEKQEYEQEYQDIDLEYQKLKKQLNKYKNENTKLNKLINEKNQKIAESLKLAQKEKTQKEKAFEMLNNQNNDNIQNNELNTHIQTITIENNKLKNKLIDIKTKEEEIQRRHQQIENELQIDLRNLSSKYKKLVKKTLQKKNDLKILKKTKTKLEMKNAKQKNTIINLEKVIKNEESSQTRIKTLSLENEKLLNQIKQYKRDLKMKEDEISKESKIELINLLAKIRSKVENIEYEVLLEEIKFTQENGIDAKAIYDYLDNSFEKSIFDPKIEILNEQIEVLKGKIRLENGFPNLIDLIFTFNSKMINNVQFFQTKFMNFTLIVDEQSIGGNQLQIEQIKGKVFFQENNTCQQSNKYGIQSGEKFIIVYIQIIYNKF
ncbi:dual specificity protein kinase pyk3 [Anaeramoeba flamelloides]|uniref:Dual specificity protein kinase pyk3 n=1 Tax=Anaeramoeba flamelloides TaxID=1746091 RepID=A0ABQ8XLR0_9EUKA|nr:dual specificity protein kinase pyk3 [Anaeramoeba flamelloides]